MKYQEKSGYTGTPPIVAGSFTFALVCLAFLVSMISGSFTLPRGSSPSAGISLPEDLAAGRQIYEGENCIACHSRTVRTADRGLGPVANRGILNSFSGMSGSSRIGPDLQNIGGRYPESLLASKITNPGSLQPDTLMPSYNHLTDDEVNLLIKYIGRRYGDITGWESRRALNDIEDTVPDTVLNELLDFFNPDTGEFRSPVSPIPEFILPGRGLYQAHCSGCHGMEGHGDGPLTYRSGDGIIRPPGAGATLVKPNDFSDPDFLEKSTPMVYWQISEGIPGSGMPGWGSSLSEEAQWLLVGYVQWLGTRQNEAEDESR